MVTYQLQLQHQVVDGMAAGAEETVLAADEAQEHGELEVAQVMDFVDETIVCHGQRSVGDASPVSMGSWDVGNEVQVGVRDATLQVPAVGSGAARCSV